MVVALVHIMISPLIFLIMIASITTRNKICRCYAFASHTINHHYSISSSSNPQSTFSSSNTHWMLRGGAISSSSSSKSISPSTFSNPRHSSAIRRSFKQRRSTTTTSSTATFVSNQVVVDSLSIAGISDTASIKSFGGLTYRDTFSEPEDFRVLFVLGGPGAGKGTQCELLKQNYPCVHLSAGQLLREEAQKKETSEHAALIEECLVAGKIVPVEISLTLLRNAMRDAKGKSLIFLVDGFPRNFDNLDGWTRYMTASSSTEKTTSGIAAVWGVLVYECPLAILEKRVMERSKNSGRSDDNLESLRRRFQTFQAETVPVIDTLRRIEEETLLKVVDIRGDQSLENVWEDTQKTMNSFIANDVLSANIRLLKAAAAKDVNTYRSLCADELFEIGGISDTNDNEISKLVSPEQIMSTQEGSDGYDFNESYIKCAEMTFVTGEKVSLSYDRTINNGVSFKETRIWAHQGSKGWRMVHFYRSAGL